MVHHLTQDAWLIDPALLAQHGRTARTVAKTGPLRVTILALAAGGELPTHQTDGPVTIHVLTGDVCFEALGREYPLHVGDVLVLAAGVAHAARSSGGCVMLLTVVHSEAPPPAQPRDSPVREG